MLVVTNVRKLDGKNVRNVRHVSKHWDWNRIRTIVRRNVYRASLSIISKNSWMITDVRLSVGMRFWKADLLLMQLLCHGVVKVVVLKLPSRNTMLSWHRTLICILIIIKLKILKTNLLVSEVICQSKEFTATSPCRLLLLRKNRNTSRECKPTSGQNTSLPSRMHSTWYCLVGLLCVKFSGPAPKRKTMPTSCPVFHNWLSGTMQKDTITLNTYLTYKPSLTRIRQKEQWTLPCLPSTVPLFTIH